MFLKIDIPALNFLIDILSGDPYLIFSSQKITSSNARANLNDDERTNLICQVSNCDKRTV